MPALAEHGVGVDDRHHPGAVPDLLRGVLEGVAADQVHHGVDPLVELLADRPGGVVEHLVGAELPHPVLVVGAGGADDVGTERLGDLDGEVADAARGRVDEHPLARLDVERLDEALVGGHAGQRERRRLLEGEAGRLAGHRALGGGHELGGGAERDVVAAYVAEDLVADLHPGAYGGADGLDDTGDVPAGDDREVVRVGALQVALADLPVDRVHAGGPGTDEHRVGSDRRVGHLADREHLGSAVLVVDRCAHRGPFGSGTDSVPNRPAGTPIPSRGPVYAASRAGGSGVGTPGESRTRTGQDLNLVPLPVGLRARGHTLSEPHSLRWLRRAPCARLAPIAPLVEEGALRPSRNRGALIRGGLGFETVAAQPPQPAAAGCCATSSTSGCGCCATSSTSGCGCCATSSTSGQAQPAAARPRSLRSFAT